MTRRPHALILVENLPVPFDRRVWQEALALSDGGYRVTVICPRGSGRASARRERLAGIDIRRFWLPREGAGLPGLALEYAIAMVGMLVLSLRVLLRHRVDVVHVCNPPDLLFVIARLARLLRGCAVVFDHHDASPELAVQKGFRERGLVHRILVLLERLTFRTADVVISTNESYRALASTRGGLAPEDVFVVRSAPREGLFDHGIVRPELKGGADTLVVYLGVMGAQEGLDVLLDAVGRLPDRLVETTRFVLVGDGPQRPAVERHVHELGLSGVVALTGRISDEELADHLATADLCVNPDPPGPLNDISTMNKVVEYLATGNAIVQFDTVEGRYSAGEAALYAQFGPDGLAEALTALIEDADLRAKMGRLGRERFHEQLAWERQVPSLLAAYERARAVARSQGRRRRRPRGDGA